MFSLYKDILIITLLLSLYKDTVDPRFNGPRFNGLCLLADNQPRSELKSVSVQENPVGGGRVGNIIH